MKYAAILSLVLLSACGAKQATEDRPNIVKVPVPAECVSGERPVEPKPLKEQDIDWYSLSHKQKTELAGSQALKRQSYGQELNAATSACK